MTERRVPAPIEKPVVLTIAGSDSGGGAGIQADLKTIEATGGFGTSAVTAATAQNTTGVESSHVLPIEEIDAQIDAVRSDFDVRAVKTGMLATAEIVETVAAAVAELDAPAVVDPVMIAATGDRLLSESAEAAYEGLIAEAALVTPNADEAAVLTGVELEGEASARRAGERLLEMGADAALLKGGHVPGETVRDVLVTADRTETFSHPRVDTDATHGSGCTLSAAIATRLARGESMSTAVERSVGFMQRAVRYHHDRGAGPGAVHHLVGLRNEAARWPTVASLEAAAERLRASDLASLLAADGTNLVFSTPYAGALDDVASFDGGRTNTDGDLESNGRIRFGVPSVSARRLLDARTVRPDLRAAIECRFDDGVETAMASLGWTVLEWRDDARVPDGSANGVLVLARDETATVCGSDPDTLVDALSELYGAL